MLRRFGLLLNTEGTAAPSGAQPAAAPAAPAPAPAPAVAVVAPASVTPAAPAAGVAADGTVDPSWLNPRLERERATERGKLLKELGVTDPAAAKQILADAAAAAEAKKTAEQRANEAGTRATALEAENVRLREATTTYANAQMAALTVEQQTAVRAIAPDTDPAGQLRTIAALAPTWGKPAAPTATASGTLPAAPATTLAPTTATPPASGTAPPAGPAPGSVSPVDHKAVYADLKSKNPHAASLYLNQHHAAIYPQK